jgi:hypothetical protein
MHSDGATKFCIDCRQTLPIEAFHRNCRTRDGRAVYCKVCASIRRYGPVADRQRKLHKGTARVLARIAADRKFCKGCGETKSLSQEFYRNNNTADGHSHLCKVCHRAAVKRTADPERVRQYAERYRFLNRERIRGYKAVYDARQRDK